MIIFLFGISISAGIGYVTLLNWIANGWKQTMEWHIPDNFTPSTTVSVVIAARNEEQSISKCIRSVLNQTYDKSLFEIIVVDDDSTDGTLDILESFDNARLKILSNARNIGKKAALELAISSATSTLIVCTDADCIVPKDWLKNIVSYYEQYKPRLIAGLIAYENKKSILQQFQFYDGITNMATTATGIFYKKYYLANGANLAYERSLFQELNGYTNDNLASGDDMMLIQRTAKQYNSDVHFLKSTSSIVTTKPVTSLKELIQQRKRWATKSKYYEERTVLLVQGYVFGTVALVVGLMLSFFLFGTTAIYCSITLLTIKLTTDYFFLKKLSIYFEETINLRLFLITILWYHVYILWAGWNAFFPSKYTWKGRHVN